MRKYKHNIRANEFERLEESKLSKFASGIAVGAALIFGGHNTSASAQSIDRNNKVEQTSAEKRLRVIGDMPEVPNGVQRHNEVC